MFRHIYIIIFVFLLVAVEAVSPVLAKEFRIFYEEEGGSDNNNSVTDYYINGGSNEGIKKNMLLNMYRLKRVNNPFTEQKKEIKILFGKMKVISVYEDVSIARVDSLESIKSNPIVGLQTAKVGDYLKTAPYQKKKPMLTRTSSPKLPNITSSNIMFDVNSWKIKPEAFSLLLKVAEMANFSKDKLIIEGHSSNEGTKENNLRLSRKRAESVVAHIRNLKKIPKKRIVAIGFGEERPVASKTTKEGRAKNRRVEFKIVPSN